MFTNYSSLFRHFSFSMRRRPPRSTLFPYTTLFRSHHRVDNGQLVGNFGKMRKKVRNPEAAATTAAKGPVALAQQSHLSEDRKSIRLNSSHEWISYAVFCLKKKKITRIVITPTASLR